MSEEPRRWSSSDGNLSASYEDAVAAFRADGPSEAQLARMLSAVSTGSASAASSAVFASKSTLTALGVATLLAGALWLWHVPSSPVVRTRPSVEVAPRHPAPALQNTRVGPAPPAPEITPKETPRVRARKRADTKRAPASSADPWAELQLLQRARRTLATNPARTLALTDEHARSYVSGSFAEEREALAIEALIGLGEQAAAARRLVAFRARFGHSIHLQRLEALMAQ